MQIVLLPQHCPLLQSRLLSHNTHVMWGVTSLWRQTERYLYRELSVTNFIHCLDRNLTNTLVSLLCVLHFWFDSGRQCWLCKSVYTLTVQSVGGCRSVLLKKECLTELYLATDWTRDFVFLTFKPLWSFGKKKKEKKKYTRLNINHKLRLSFVRS